MTIKLSPLAHIEITVPNAEKAYQLLHNIFGAEKVLEPFAKFLDGKIVKVIHVGLGDVVLQFIEPVQEGTSWYNQLKTKGPGVHNLTFTVDNIKEAVKELEKEGNIVPLFSFDLEWEKIIPSKFVNPNAKTIYMMDCMEKFGFHLELAEVPFTEDLKLPETQYVTGENELIGNVSPMLHIELVTNDAEKTYELLHKLFGSEKVEIEFANFLDTPFMHIIHVNLSNVVLQYCQPIVKKGVPSWAELLDKYGTYVHNITFVVDDIPETAEKFKKEGIYPVFTFPLQWDKVVENAKSDLPPIHMMNTMEKLGFHLELGEMVTNDPDSIKELLFVDLTKYKK